MLLVNEAATQFFYRIVELHAYHQATASHFLDAGNLFQFREQVFAHFSCVLHQLLFLEDFEHGDGSGAAEVVAAEGGAQHSVHGFEGFATNERAHGVTVANAFCHGHDVGFDATPLMRKEFSRTAVTALYLVEDEHHAGFAGQLAQLLHKFRGRNLDAAHALNAFYDHGCHIAFGNFRPHGFNVAKWHDGYVGCGIHGCLYLGIVGGFHRERGASVECLAEGYHAWLSGVKRCQFHRILVGFGSGVDEKQLIVGVAANAAQFFCQFHLQAIHHRIAVKHQLLGLAFEGFHVVRVAVAHRNHGMAAI